MAIICGILLIISSWFGIALNSGDILGSILVLIGMVLGFCVFLKMNKGVFVKNLRKTL